MLRSATLIELIVVAPLAAAVSLGMMIREVTATLEAVTVSSMCCGRTPVKSAAREVLRLSCAVESKSLTVPEKVKPRVRTGSYVPPGVSGGGDGGGGEGGGGEGGGEGGGGEGGGLGGGGEGGGEGGGGEGGGEGGGGEGGGDGGGDGGDGGW